MFFCYFLILSIQIGKNFSESRFSQLHKGNPKGKNKWGWGRRAYVILQSIIVLAVSELETE